MSRKDWTEYDKQCRAPFTDSGGKITLPKHPNEVDAAYLQQLAVLTDKVPEAHKQGFIRLYRRVFGLKVLNNGAKNERRLVQI